LIIDWSQANYLCGKMPAKFEHIQALIDTVQIMFNHLREDIAVVF
jgi:hypothetical protein